MNAKDKIMEAIREFRFWNYGMDNVDPNSEYAEWVPDLADAICAALDDQPFHALDAGETSWILKHPLDCRNDLLACTYNRAAAALDEEPGQYRVSLSGVKVHPIEPRGDNERQGCHIHNGPHHPGGDIDGGEHVEGAESPSTATGDGSGLAGEDRGGQAGTRAGQGTSGGQGQQLPSDGGESGGASRPSDGPGGLVAPVVVTRTPLFAAQHADRLCRVSFNEQGYLVVDRKGGHQP